MVKSAISDRRGALSIPLLLGLLVLCLAAWGTWGLLRQWRFLVETQLRLDRCVARTAVLLRDTQERLISTNLQIIALRAAIEAAGPQPQVLIPLETALLIEVGVQEFTRRRWDAQRIQWLSRGTCGDRADLAIPLPSLQWTRDPPDSYGFKPLRWPGKMPTELRIQLSHKSRAAAAKVFPEGAAKGGVHGETQTNWKAEWAPPRIAFQL